jgi:hypothetical protein
MVDCLEVQGIVMPSGVPSGIAKSARDEAAQDTIPTLQGDFDGDGKRETAYLGRPSKMDSIDCCAVANAKSSFSVPKSPISSLLRATAVRW